MAEESTGVQLTIGAGWLSKTVAALLAAWVIGVSATLIQVQVTRYTAADAAPVSVRVEGLETLTRQLSVVTAQNSTRLDAIDKSLDSVADDTKWIRRNLAGAK